MDSETQKVYTDGEAYSDLVKSRGWILAKEQIVTPFLIDLQSVQNIKHSSESEMAREVFARQLAVSYVMELLKDIEGKADQHKSNTQLMRDPVIVQN